MNFNDFGAGLVAIVTAVIGLAIISVILSRNSNTVPLVNASGTTLANVIKAAVSPVTGTNGNLAANTFSTPNLQPTT